MRDDGKNKQSLIEIMQIMKEKHGNDLTKEGVAGEAQMAASLNNLGVFLAEQGQHEDGRCASTASCAWITGLSTWTA